MAIVSEISAVLSRADVPAYSVHSGPTPASPPNFFSNLIIIAILLGALGLTAYGFYEFDFSQARFWPAEELWQFALALCVPALLLFGLSFWRGWPRIAVAVVLASALVTYGPAVVCVLAFCAIGLIAIGQLAAALRLETIEDGLLALVVGFGLLGLVVGLSASVRLHFDFVYAAVMALAIIAAHRRLLGWIKMLAMRTMARSSDGLWRRISNHAAISITLLSAIGAMLYATAVENGPDALSTHFAFAETLREHGFMALDPDTWPAIFMPKATVWGLSVVHVVGGEFALRAAHAGFLSVAAALVAMRAARSMHVGPAALLSATFLSAPVCLWISSQFFEETGALMFISAAAVFFLRAETEPRPRFEDWRAFAALGFAVSAKMQVLFLGVLGAALVLRRLNADPTARGFRDVLVGVLIFLALGTGFYLRAYIMTGNPIFPFVPGEGVDPRWERPMTLSAPFDMVFSTGNMEAYAGGFAFQFLLLLGAGIAVLAVPAGRSVRWFGVVALVFAVVMASQTLYARYQLYAFPLLMLALAALYPLITTGGRVVVSIALAGIVLANFCFWRSVHVAPFQLSQLAAPQTFSYIAPERRAFDALDALYGRNTVVYVAGPSAVTAGSSGMVHAITRLAKELNAAPSLSEIARLLRLGRVTHIVMSGKPYNAKVVEICRLVCNSFPIKKELGLTIYAVDPSKVTLVADRLDAAELLGLPPPAEATPTVGWSQREAWGWWSIEPTADVKLVGFAAAVEIFVELQPFAPPGTDGLDVKVSLDGVRVADWRFEPGSIGIREERRIQLPKPVGIEDPGILSFEFSRTYTPKATLGTTDERPLAIGLIGVRR